MKAKGMIDSGLDSAKIWRTGWTTGRLFPWRAVMITSERSQELILNTPSTRATPIPERWSHRPIATISASPTLPARRLPLYASFWSEGVHLSSTLTLRSLTRDSGKLTLYDAGPRCKISRYWVCRRYLPPSDPTDEESISPDFSLLPVNALLILLQFIRIELLDDLGKHCGPPYELEGWGPGLLIFESRDPADLDASHCRWVADSRAFPARFPEHTPIEPNLPLLWADCETTEEDDGERNIVQRILRAFLPDGERQAPIVLASTVLDDMFSSSRYS